MVGEYVGQKTDTKCIWFTLLALNISYPRAMNLTPHYYTKKTATPIVRSTILFVDFSFK